MRCDRGFSLVELVGVMLVVSIGFVGLARMFSNMEFGLATAEAQDKTVKYAQMCAEYVLQTRRDLGYSSSSLTNTMCNSLISTADSAAGYAFGTSMFGLEYRATPTGICPNTPSTALCKDVTISVSGGGAKSTVVVTIMNY